MTRSSRWILPHAALLLLGAAAQDPIEDLITSLSKASREDQIESIAAKIAVAAGRNDPIRERARDALRKGVLKRREALDARARAAAGQALRSLKVELNRRREAALKLIRDESIYLREDHPRWREGGTINGQAKVDHAVEEVRSIWESPGRHVVSLLPQVRKDLKGLNECYGRCLALLEGDPEDDALQQWEEGLIASINGRVDLRTVVVDGKEAGVRDWNTRVTRFNDSLRDEVAPAEAREHARALNGYREMLGLKQLFLDGKLCRAAAKHSAAMGKAGRIWHEGADGTPAARVQAEKFPGTFVAENVSMGHSSPADFWWKGWYRASDHHRAAIKPDANCFGYGQDSGAATQVFGTTGTPKGL